MEKHNDEYMLIDYTKGRDISVEELQKMYTDFCDEVTNYNVTYVFISVA